MDDTDPARDLVLRGYLDPLDTKSLAVYRVVQSHPGIHVRGVIETVKAERTVAGGAVFDGINSLLSDGLIRSEYEILPTRQGKQRCKRLYPVPLKELPPVSRHILTVPLMSGNTQGGRPYVVVSAEGLELIEELTYRGYTVKDIHKLMGITDRTHYSPVNRQRIAIAIRRGEDRRQEERMAEARRLLRETGMDSRRARRYPSPTKKRFVTEDFFTEDKKDHGVLSDGLQEPNANR